jgi:hypothetical protein
MKPVKGFVEYPDVIALYRLGVHAGNVRLLLRQ